MEIKTNHKPRPIIYGFELSPAERAEFDYLDDDRLDNASFFRYKGEVYDIGEFVRIEKVRSNPFTVVPSDDDSQLFNWHGTQSDSYFSGLVIKYCDDNDYIIVGRYTC